MILLCRHLTVLSLTCAGIAACGDDHPQDHFTFLEEIRLSGTCKENHALKADDYGGSVVRWRKDASGELLTYGFVQVKQDIADRVLKKVETRGLTSSPSIGYGKRNILSPRTGC
jgi:hypothetical protein